MVEHVRALEAWREATRDEPRAVAVTDRLRREVERMLEGHRAGEAVLLTPLRHSVPALRGSTDEELRAHPLTRTQAEQAIAGLYWFTDWAAVERAEGLVDPDFEDAADAVVEGDLETLERLLTERPGLVAEHSPFGHGATLLHYVSANGVETWRQKTPGNAVAVTRTLLEAGAAVDARCRSYGGGPHTTPLCLTVSSGHPAEAGLQGALAATLLDAGAAIEGVTDDGMPLTTALAFGYTDTAELLVERGARIRSLVVAAGLGRSDLVRTMLAGDLEPYVDPWAQVVTGRQALLDRALLQAARPGRDEIAELLLDAGAHADASVENGRTAMHWAAYAGARRFVELLVQHGGDPARPDDYYGTPPSAWARAGGHEELAAWLEDRAEDRRDADPSATPPGPGSPSPADG